MKGRVDSCTRRRDDKWMVVIAKPGGIKITAVSDVELRVGSDAMVRDGKATRA